MRSASRDRGGGLPRLRPGGMGDAALTAHLAAFFAPVAAQAVARGVTYCIEPLSRAEDNTVNTVADGVALAEAIARLAAQAWPQPAPAPAPLYIRPANAAPSADLPPVLLD